MLCLSYDTYLRSTSCKSTPAEKSPFELCSDGDVEAIRKLIESKAAIDTHEIDGSTLAQEAAKRRHSEILSMLIATNKFQLDWESKVPYSKHFSVIEYARRNKSVMNAVVRGFDLLRDSTFEAVDGFAVEVLSLEVPRALTDEIVAFLYGDKSEYDPSAPERPADGPRSIPLSRMSFRATR